MNDKILTIAIPAYNAEKTINKCIESLVVAKNIDDLDIIVVNDGSNDNTSNLVSEYVCKYPLSIRLINKKNAHLGSVYNKAIPLAKGKYFKLLDSDDTFDSNNLDLLINKLKSVNADIILTDFNIVNELGEITKIKKCINGCFDNYERECMLSDYIDQMCLEMHSLLFKTEILKTLPEKFDERCYYVDTEYVLFPLAYANSFVAYDFVVYNYLLGTETQSMNINNVIKHINEHEKIVIRSIDYYEKYLSNKKIKKGTLDYVLGRLSAHYKYLLYSKKYQDIKRINDYIKNNYEKFYSELILYNDKDHISFVMRNINKNGINTKYKLFKCKLKLAKYLVILHNKVFKN